MRSSTILAAVIIHLVLTPPSLAQNVELAVDSKIDEFFRAVSDENIDELAATLSADFQAIERGVRRDRTEFLDLVGGFFEGGGTFDFDLTERTTETRGDIATSSFHATDRDSGDKYFDLFVLRRIEGKWYVSRMASTHSPQNDDT